jgi:hypothetical protein
MSWVVPDRLRTTIKEELVRGRRVGPVVAANGDPGVWATAARGRVLID